MRTKRLAVLSDIHGNLPVLRTVLKDIEKHTPDRILVTGDLCGGPQQDESIALLRSQQAVTVLGNWEQNIFSFRKQPSTNPKHHLSQFAFLKWCSHNLSHQSMAYLKTRPVQTAFSLPGTTPIRLAHGSPDNPYTLIDPETNLSTVLEQVKEDVFICGHTHTPWVTEKNGKLAVNPGSLFNTINHKSEATYALLEWDGSRWQAEIKAVPFDLRLVIRAFEESGLIYNGGPLARAILLSIQTGENVSQTFVDHAIRIAKRKTPTAQFVPDQIWWLAEKSFNWRKYAN